MYGAALITILACHEAGHFIQTRRYRVSASLPFFLPLPLPPIGTLGAVIGMDARISDRRALFDIDSGLPLGETTIGIGSRGLGFGPDGELYVGAEIGILCVNTDSLIRNRLLPDFDNEGSSQ